MSDRPTIGVSLNIIHQGEHPDGYEGRRLLYLERTLVNGATHALIRRPEQTVA